MEKRRLRVRRTIAPETPSSQPLTRSLWGVAAGDATLAFDQQRASNTAESAALDAEIRSARALLEQLTQAVDREKRHVHSLREVVRVLREKLAQERAARAVLATRLLDRQGAEQQLEAQTRLETVRLSADIQQEHEALRQLVGALYRSISGRQGVPSGLEVLATLPAPAPSTSSRTSATPWHRFLTGKKAGRTLHAADGRVVLQDGETIGPDELQAAEREGLLFDLILSARVAERLPDL